MVVAEEQGVSNVVLKYGIDQAGLDQVKTATDSIQKGLQNLEDSAKRLEKAAQSDSEVFKQMAASSELIGRSSTITQIAQQFATLGKATGDYESQLKNLRQGLAEFGADAQEIRKATTEFNLMRNEIDDDAKSLQELRDTLNDTEKQSGGSGGGSFGLQGLRGAGRALNQLGLRDIGEPIQKIGDVGEVAKVLQDLNAAALPTTASLKAATLAFTEVALPIAPLVVALGGLLLIAKQISDEFAKGQQAVARAVEAEKAGFDKRAQIELAASTMTSKAVEDRRAALLIEQAAAQDYLNTVSRNITDLTNAKNASGNILERASLQKSLDELKPAQDKAVEANQKLIDEYKTLTDDIKPLVDAREAESQAIAETISTLQQQADMERQLAQDRKIKTSQQAQDQLEQLKSDADILNKQIEALAPSTGVGKDDANREMERLQAQLSAIIVRIQQLNTEIKPAVESQEHWNNAIKATTDSLKKGIEQVIAVDAARTKLNDDLEKISGDRLQKLTDIEKAYADKRVDIAQKAVQAAQDSLTKLEQHQEDLFTSLGRDMTKALADEGYKENDLRIQAARQEVTDKQEHLTRLRDIQRSFYESDQQANLDRNFVQLAKNRLSESSQINTENSKFIQQEQQRVVALSNQISDDRRHLVQQRQQRLVAYQEQLADANKAYTRELQQQGVVKERELAAAKAADVRQIADTNQHFTQMEQQRRLAFQHELAQLTQHEKQKLDVEQLFQNETIKSVVAGVTVAKQLAPLGNLLGKMLTGRAEGGPLSAFQDSLVNEPNSSGRESFTSAGRTIGLPGFGIFTPLTGGTVNANKGEAPQITNVWNITGGGDPQATARALEPMVKRVTYETVKQVVG